MNIIIARRRLDAAMAKATGAGGGGGGNGTEGMDGDVGTTDVVFTEVALGLELRQRPGQPVLVHATHGVDAEGVRIGSMLVAIAGESVAELSLAAVRSRIGAAERPLTLRFHDASGGAGNGGGERGGLPRVYGPRWQVRFILFLLYN